MWVEMTAFTSWAWPAKTRARTPATSTVGILSWVVSWYFGATLRAADGGTLVSHAALSGIDSIAARDQFYGAQIGSIAAEPFIMRATLHVADPLAHLRSRPGPALLFEAR